MAGLTVLAVQGGNLLGLVTRDKPVAALTELRGMRIRVPAELVDVLRELGADPVSMPMADVYSALAKGVIDGVVAPQDTFRSLHLAEVARYYTNLAVPRGAYPSRAMSSKRWERLSSAQRAVLEESIAIWEAALADENRRAQQEGWQHALAEGIVEVPISAEDQAKFDAIYAREAQRAAARLSRYGIDGERVLAVARRSVGPDGRVDCRRDSP
jgi:TRAP-type C4-dicarboxylate transport system substrate-binding protein